VAEVALTPVSVPLPWKDASPFCSYRSDFMNPSRMLTNEKVQQSQEIARISFIKRKRHLFEKISKGISSGINNFFRSKINAGAK
jgi:hypothetical protein